MTPTTWARTFAMSARSHKGCLVSGVSMTCKVHAIMDLMYPNYGLRVYGEAHALHRVRSTHAAQREEGKGEAHTGVRVKEINLHVGAGLRVGQKRAGGKLACRRAWF